MSCKSTVKVVIFLSFLLFLKLIFVVEKMSQDTLSGWKFSTVKDPVTLFVKRVTLTQSRITFGRLV